MGRKQSSERYFTRRKLLKYGAFSGLTAGLAPVLWLSGCRKQRHGTRPNILLITLDTTRADRLSCYGYYRRTSPNIDRLSVDSVLYTRAIAPSSWTLPSHASLFTGKFTSSHGAKYDPKGPLRLTDAIRGPSSWKVYRARGLGRDELTLADILKGTGYATGAVVGGPWLKKIFGLNKGFDYYDDAEINTLNGRLARQITDVAASWIEKSRHEEFFLFLNYFDPHSPYSPPEGFAKAFLPKDWIRTQRRPSVKEINARYDAEILYMDHYIGQLMRRLKSYDLYDNTLIIVTADHGELLGEHSKFSHGHYLYQQELHIPLLVKYPNKEVLPTRTDVPVLLNDIFAIILGRLGIELPPNVQAGVPPKIEHPLLAETYPLPVLSADGHWRAIFEGPFKFIWNSKGRHLLFNLTNDPAELVNLAEQQNQQAKDMMSKMNQYLTKLPRPGPALPAQELDEDTKRALKSLGYVD
jgi:arylsulfatase A-like enzyme